MDTPPRLPAGLYLVGTPIGNLRDITLRAIDTLMAADTILAEDTRHSRRLLDAHGIRTRMISCHQFNEAARTQSVTDDIAAGRALALISDAGMPGISDPGARVVRACRAAGLPVHVVPGASSVTSAVALSGWGDAGFVFEGFLSHKSAARRRVLAGFAREMRAVVLFESPFRFRKLLDELEDILPARPVYVARELTKTFEQGELGLPGELKKRTIPDKGEFVVVLAPLRKSELPPDDAFVESESDESAQENGASIDSGKNRC